MASHIYNKYSNTRRTASFYKRRPTVVKTPSRHAGSYLLTKGVKYNFLLCRIAWWRHEMETFSALLALCAGNSPVPVNSPHKGQWRGAFVFSLICTWINDWVNNHEAGDLRRHHGHYDANVMARVKVNTTAFLQPYLLSARWATELQWQPPGEYICEIVEKLCVWNISYCILLEIKLLLLLPLQKYIKVAY